KNGKRLVELDPYRQVVGYQPKLSVFGRVEREEDLAEGNPPHLRQAQCDVVPVMDCQDRHGDVERAICKRELLGDGLNDSAAAWALPDHYEGRLDGGDECVCRLVVPCTGADIHYSRGLPEGVGNLIGDPCVWLSRR